VTILSSSYHKCPVGGMLNLGCMCSEEVSYLFGGSRISRWLPRSSD